MATAPEHGLGRSEAVAKNPLAATSVAVRTVIVNYRTPGLTIDCLKSLEPERVDNPGLSVVVVEGGSGDDSAEQLRDAIKVLSYGDWVTLDVRETNAGFAGGNNAAILPALAESTPPDFIWLLNPDTVVRPGAVKALLDFLNQNQSVGIAGSRLEDPDGTPQRSAFRFPTLISEFQGNARFGPITALLKPWVIAPEIRETSHQTDWLAGASMMVRREVFDALDAGLDDAYFMYYEELDFCLAAKRAGFGCWYVPESRVVHLVGQASGVTGNKDGKVQKRRPAYWFESRKRFFAKNHGRLFATLADTAWMIGFSLWRTRRFLMQKLDNDPPKLLMDFFRQSVFIKGFGRINSKNERMTQ